MPQVPENFERGQRVYVSTESVNAYGFRLLTSGIMMDAFLASPTMTYNHIRSAHYADNVIFYPVGAWEDVKVDGSGRLSMVPVFNTKYDEGLRCSQMWKDNFLNGASVYVEILELSEDPELMLPGQTRPTITKCRLREVAISDMPVNYTCHKVSYQGVELSLSADIELDLLDEILPIVQKQLSMEVLKLAAVALGLPETSTDTQVIAKLTEMKNQNAALTHQVQQLVNQNEELKKQVASSATQALSVRLATVLDKAESDGKITKTDRPNFEALAKPGGELTEASLSALEATFSNMKAYVAPSTQIESATGTDGLSGNAALSARYFELDKAGKLAQLPKDERDALIAGHLAYQKEIGRVKAIS